MAVVIISPSRIKKQTGWKSVLSAYLHFDTPNLFVQFSSFNRLKEIQSGGRKSEFLRFFFSKYSSILLILWRGLKNTSFPIFSCENNTKWHSFGVVYRNDHSGCKTFQAILLKFCTQVSGIKKCWCLTLLKKIFAKKWQALEVEISIWLKNKWEFFHEKKLNTKWKL